MKDSPIILFANLGYDPSTGSVFDKGAIMMHHLKPADQKLIRVIDIGPHQTVMFESEIKTEQVTGDSGAMMCILKPYGDSEKMKGTSDWKRVKMAVVNTTGAAKKIPFCISHAQVSGGSRTFVGLRQISDWKVLFFLEFLHQRFSAIS